MINRLFFFLATRFGWLLITALGKLTRIECHGLEHFERLKKQRERFIICTWHGRMLLPIYYFRKQNIHVIVSEHRDGEMIARTVEKLGYFPIRGSSTRGGRKAALGLIRAIKQGYIGCIIPDGPRGPALSFKKGALQISQKTGAKLLPITFSAARAIHLGSWDRFTLWQPFTRALVLIGEPIAIPQTNSDAALEALRRDVEAAMRKQVESADASFQK